MNDNASRGAILIVVAAVVGAIVLAKGFDDNTSASLGTSADTEVVDAADDAPAFNSDGVAIGLIDADGDGEPETLAIDTTGDDVPDTAAFDADGDGDVDTVANDTRTLLTPVARAPADVRVLVANAARVGGAAGNATSKLVARGYNPLTPVNADDLFESTVVYFEPDFEVDAQLVAEILAARPDQLEPMPATDPEGVDRRGAPILVMLGADEVSQPPDDEG